MKTSRKTLFLIMMILFSVASYASTSVDKKERIDLKLKGFVQAIGYAGVFDNGHYTDQFQLRRARLDVRVKGGTFLEGRIQGDLVSNRLMDAYVVFKPLTYMNIAFGQFKYPMSRERAQSVPSLFFNDFSYTAQIAPNRDLGIRISGAFAKGIFSYQATVLNGSPDGGYPSAETSDAKDIAGRVEWKPIPQKMKALSIGLGGSAGIQHQGKTGSITTPGRTKVFIYDEQAKIEGQSFRIAPFLCYYGGRFTMIGEYISSYHHMINGENSAVLINRAGSVSLSLILAGGVRQVSGFINEKPFDISDNCWGGWELVTRIHGFYADPETFPHFASAESSVSGVITAEIGVNWFPLDNTGLKLVYSASYFKSGSETGDRPSEHLLTLTANLAF